MEVPFGLIFQFGPRFNSTKTIQGTWKGVAVSQATCTVSEKP